jgi:GGDEF domain-containing protein
LSSLRAKAQAAGDASVDLPSPEGEGVHRIATKGENGTMNRMRAWIILLIGWLFLFFNIERINEPIDISSFVYVLATLATAAMLLLWRISSKVHLAVFMSVVYAFYFTLKPLLGYEIGGKMLPLAITEVASLLVTVLIAKQISVGMLDFEQTIENLTFRQIGLPPELYESVDAERLYRELKRSRRFQHPLSLIVMKPNVDAEKIEMTKALKELQNTMALRYLQARLAKILSEELRDCDVVAIERDQFVILLPETDASVAQQVMEKTVQYAHDTLDVDVSFGVAQFPENGITLSSLIESAVDGLDSSRSKLPV